MRFLMYGLMALVLSTSCQPTERSSPPLPATSTEAAQAPKVQAEVERAVATTAGRPSLGSGSLELRAYWEPMIGSDLAAFLASPVYGHHFANLVVAEERRTYKASDFSVFLPDKSVRVGETWAVPREDAAAFLEQFHAGATANLNVPGSGAFATLRARSRDHWDILFRVHAQFVLAPRVFLTPGQFAGRLVLNLGEATVEHVSFSVPTERHTNLDIEVLTSGHRVGLAFVPRMELLGGDSSAPETIAWTDEIDHTEARRLLSARFFAFQAIDWVPLEQTLERAQKGNRPIFAIVIKGVLDDQSC